MTDKDRDLVKQILLAKRSYVVGGHTKHEWVNPDGPAAADLIETQAREIERLRGLLREAEVKLTDVQGAYATKQYSANLLTRIRAALAGDSHDQ